MRVLALVGGFLEVTGGIETYSRSLIGALLQMEEVDSLEILALNDSRGLDSSKAGRKVTYKGFQRNKITFALRALAAARRADVVIAIHINFATLFPYLNLVNGKARKMVVVHGIEVWQRLTPAKLRGAMAAEKILPVSDFTRGQLIHFNPELQNKSFSILSGTFDPDYAKESRFFSRDELKLPAGKMLLAVTRLKDSELYKNVDMVVRAMPSVLAHHPDAFLVVVGEGEDKVRLKEIAHDLHVEHKVMFVGRVSSEQLPSFYRNCDIFVLPSTKEGLGIVYLEAMQFSKPCIGVTAGAAKEVISDGETGLLVNADDPPQLPDAINRLLSDESVMRKMGAAGYERLQQQFSPTRFGAKLREILLKAES
jgi:glycosyltransferase involved in cell wall biosynthesis